MDYNILIADFAGKNRICMTDTLYQYDYGQKLQIVNIAALPQTFEAHFSNVQHGGVSITVTGMDGIVDIPNSLLMTGKRIYCWIYVTEPGSGETVYQILLPVQHRPMPEYYDVTDVGVFDSVVQQVGDYAATATAGATNATASAAAAAASADNAAASASAAESAKTAAETAQGEAEDAQTAAETAAQTATEKAQQSAQDAAQAAQSKADAESAAGRAEAAQTGAESAKTDAETAAQGAAASASTATEKANLAGQAASAAAASETAAQTAQTGAETAASTATASATTATAKAVEAAQSASNAAASKTAAEAAATRAEQAAASLVVDDALSDTSTNPVQNKVVTESVTQVKSALDALKIVDTASGAIASFPDGAVMHVESLTVSMEPIQDLHGQSSPYPAGGGKNLLPMNIDTIKSLNTSGAWNDNSYSLNGVVFTVLMDEVENINGIRANGTATENAIFNVGRWTGIGEKVTITGCPSGGSTSTYRMFWDNGGSETGQGIQPTPSEGVTVTGRVYIYGGYTASNILFKPMICLATATDPTVFAPYSNICPITGRDEVSAWRTGVNVWDEEWEGGSYDVNGRPVADPSRIRTVNPISVVGGTSYYLKAPNTLGIRYYDINDAFISGGYSPTVMNNVSVAPNMAAYLRFSVVGTATYGNDISINYPSTDHDYHPGTVQSATIQLGQTVYGGTLDVTTGVMTVEWENIASYDGEALPGEWISDRDAYAPGTTPTTGAQVCYKLATPITIDLTPAQLSTLHGTNNVWSDADSVDVTYIADPKLYIDKKITAAVAALA